MKTLSKIVIILFLTFCPQSTHWSENVLYDLEFYSEAFRSETDSWASTMKLARGGQKTIQCGSEIMLGGPSIWLVRNEKDVAKSITLLLCRGWNLKSFLVFYLIHEQTQFMKGTQKRFLFEGNFTGKFFFYKRLKKVAV